MVSLCHLANKSLQVMAAIHAHVRDQVVLHVQSFWIVDASRKADACLMVNNSLPVMAAIRAPVRDQEALHAHQIYVDAHAMVSPLLTETQKLKSADDMIVCAFKMKLLWHGGRVSIFIH